MYTQRGQRRHRMCGVWSPLISDRLDGYCRPSLVSLPLFFFIGPYVSCVDRVPWRDAHLSARNLPLSRFDAGSQNMRAIFPPSNVAFNATDHNYAVLFIDKDEHSVSLSCRFQRNSISRLRMFVHLEEILRCKITRNTRNT